MRIVVVLVEEVDIVRGDHADVELLGELEHTFRHERLAIPHALGLGVHLGMQHAAMLHHLQREVISKKILEPARDALGLVHAPIDDRARNLAREAGAGNVQPLVVFFKQFVVDAGLVVEAVDVRLGDKTHEVVVAHKILRVQAKVEAVALDALAVVAFDDVRLAAEDGLDVNPRQVAIHLLLLGAAFVVERLQGKEVAVVGDGQGRHAQLPRTLDERDDLALAVQQRIGGVDMQMDEVGHAKVPR